MVCKIVRAGTDREGKNGLLVGGMNGWFGVFVLFWNRFHNDLMIGFRRSINSEVFDKCYLN